MSALHCFFKGCIEPVTEVHTITVDGASRDLDVCAEHFHDIDWEVVTAEELRDRVRRSAQKNLGSHDAA